MVKKLSETEAKKVLGVAGDNTYNGQIRADEFLPELRGKKAIRKYREMRDNDSTIGAVMYATEQVLRDVDLKVMPANDSAEAKKEAPKKEDSKDEAKGENRTDFSLSSKIQWEPLMKTRVATDLFYISRDFTKSEDSRKDSEIGLKTYWKWFFTSVFSTEVHLEYVRFGSNLPDYSSGRYEIGAGLALDL